MVVVVELVHNVALLVALTVLLQLIEQTWHHRKWAQVVLSGLLYGGTALAGMMTPVRFGEGVIFDGRSMVLAIAGLFGGPVVALIAAAMTAAYRIWLGGGGTVVGVSVIAMASAAGVAAHYLRRRNPRLTRPLNLWLFGIIVHVVMLGMFLFLPGDPLHTMLPKIAAPIIIAYPLGVVLIGRVLVEQENRHLKKLTTAEGSEIARFLTDNTNDCVWLSDVELEFRYINPAVERTFGYTQAEFRGTHFADHADPEHAAVFEREVQEAMVRAAEAQVVYETVLLRKDGAPVPVEVTAQALRAPDGHIAALYGTIRDIADRKRLEAQKEKERERLERLVAQRTEELRALNEELRALNEELVQTNTELTEANDAKNRFVRAMSHELRTPLNSIIGFSNILASGLAGAVNDEQQRQAEMINRSGQHLLSLINDILDLSRIEANKLDLEMAEFDLSDLVREVMESVGGAGSEHVELHLDLPDDPVSVVSDARKVRQVLFNLVGNAVKFTEAGSVSVRIRPAGRGLLAVEVTDTGPGIPAADLERIFDEFVQAGDDDEATRHGSGLGLPIARGLARALGGTITAQSKPGLGSTFTLMLPTTTTDRE